MPEGLPSFRRPGQMSEAGSVSFDQHQLLRKNNTANSKRWKPPFVAYSSARIDKCLRKLSFLPFFFLFLISFPLFESRASLFRLIFHRDNDIEHEDDRRVETGTNTYLVNVRFEKNGEFLSDIKHFIERKLIIVRSRGKWSLNGAKILAALMTSGYPAAAIKQQA